MIQFPNIQPEIFRIGPIAPRWYGLMYVIGFIAGFYIVRHWFKRDKVEATNDDLYDLALYCILGVIMGARLGYILFYNLGFYLTNPLQIFNVTAGGMSFHGGFIGVILGMLYFGYKKKIHFYLISDAMVLAGALGIAFGRIGNFINGELYGRVADLPWCMYFPGDPGSCRHPSQLYESFLEGWLLFAILWFIKSKGSSRNWRPGITSWLFVALYGLARFSVEFVREPDAHIGFEALGATRGQLLTFPMILVGVIMIFVIVSSKDEDQKASQ